MYRDVVAEFIKDMPYIDVENGKINEDDWNEAIDELTDRIKDLESLKDKLDHITDEERIKWLDKHEKSLYD